MEKIKDFYQELTEYTGRPYELVQRRCETSIFELAWRYVEDYKDDPLASYRDNDLYVFDLSHYQTELQRKGFYRLLMDTFKKINCKKILDFGGGIGEYSIVAIENGLEADFLEVEGSKTLEYAKWRFKKHGVSPEILTEKTDLTGRRYDCVLAMDVFEHIEKPGPVIDKVAEITDHIIVNPFELPFNWMYPQHISRYDDDLRKHFEIVDRYLWEKKKG